MAGWKKCILVVLTVFVPGASLPAQMVVVRPEDTGEALVNPGMGWGLHYYSNVPTTLEREGQRNCGPPNEMDAYHQKAASSRRRPFIPFTNGGCERNACPPYGIVVRLRL